jgi:Glycosyltransferase family 87
VTARPRTPDLIRTRLGIDALLILGAGLVALRLFNVYPWTATVLDLHAYWATNSGISYAGANPFLIGAYLYAPVFAQAIAPLTTLPWPVFAATWTALSLAALIWLAGRWSFALLFTGALALELYLGQIDIFIAAAIVVGFRYPVAWAFPLLTKVAPGIGLIWFAVRREWRSLAVAITATVGIAAISAILAPEAWRGWYDLIRRSVMERQTIDGDYLAVPIWLRLPVAVTLIAWGARTDRYWTVPVGVLIGMPILWINVFTLLLAVIPLREELGMTPARAWLLREVPAARPALVGESG